MSRRATPLVLLLVIAGLARTAVVRGQAPASGVLLVHVDPAALLYVDGRLIGDSEREHTTRLASGPHRLRIINPAYEDVRRTVDIGPGGTVSISLSLDDQAMRKSSAQPRSPREARVADPDLARGIQFVSEGDFAAAVDTLRAVTRSLANVPRLQREQALAYLYLGIAHAGLDELEDAKVAMAAARQDASVAPTAADFPRQVVRLWQEAASVPAEALRDAPPPPSPPPVPVERVQDKPPASVLEIDTLPVDTQFVVKGDGKTSVSFVLSVGGTPCPGVLTLDRTQKIVTWTPSVPTCSAAFDAPFAEIRSPAAAPYGGLLIQFRSARPPMVLFPSPDADLLEPGAERLTLNDLPASTRVNLRKAHREILDALGRPATDSIFGLQVDLPVEELLENVADYEGAAVRTRGTFTLQPGRQGAYFLKGETATIELTPSATARALVRSNADEWKNKEVLVSGTFTRPSTGAANPRQAQSQRAPAMIVASAIEPATSTYAGRARQMTIQEVASSPPTANEPVRIVGRFRGNNYFGDLPLETRRSSVDWVIKDQTFALWVTGKPPRGDGFDLVPMAASISAARDAQSWVAVTGTVEERRGFLYVHANTVELSPPPSEAAQVARVAVSRERSNTPPQIGFTVPVEGSEEALRDQQFLVRFTKPMDEASFEGHVQLRYADDPQNVFTNVSVTYYVERTFSIMIDPGRALEAGRTLEVLFLQGIKDADHIDLAGTNPAPRILRWRVARSR